MSDRGVGPFRSILKEYYSQNFSGIYEPANLASREFGFSFFDGSFRRHTSFRSFKEYVDFVLRNIPKDVYYSVAVYREPSLPMDEKGWLNAELPFDLDAEQLLRTQDETIRSGWISRDVYEEIKSRLIYLLEEFVEGDLGIDQKEYLVVFSGSRGYHIRILTEPYINLDQKLRRQIVEYVSLGYRPAITSDTNVVRPFSHDYGWHRRLYEQIRRLDPNRLEELGVEQMLATRRVLSAFKKARRPSEVRVSRAETDSLNKLIEWAINSSTVSVDERVTVDINRLLRAPGTVHGESGLLCRILAKNELEGFDPFRDAAMRLGSTKKVLVRRVPFEVEINGETVSPEQGGRVVEINSALAYYIVARGGGEFVEAT